MSVYAHAQVSGSKIFPYCVFWRKKEKHGFSYIMRVFVDYSDDFTKSAIPTWSNSQRIIF